MQITTLRLPTRTLDSTPFRSFAAATSRTTAAICIEFIMCPPGACSLSFGLTFERLVSLSRIPRGPPATPSLFRSPSSLSISRRFLSGISIHLGIYGVAGISERECRRAHLTTAKEWNLIQTVVKSDDFRAEEERDSSLKFFPRKQISVQPRLSYPKQLDTIVGIRSFTNLHVDYRFSCPYFTTKNSKTSKVRNSRPFLSCLRSKIQSHRHGWGKMGKTIENGTSMQNYAGMWYGISMHSKETSR